MNSEAKADSPPQTTVVPKGLWQRQFDPQNDFPQTTIVKKIALCTTPRCGSHFLGHQMHGRGCFGYPLEYLNHGNLQVWKQRAQGAGANDALDYIKSVRTGPNGVFAIKLHHEHLQEFLAHEADPLSYQFVHLQRRDLIKQAISFARAQQTGAWISDMPATVEATYDRAMIIQKAEAISLGNARWHAFLSGLGIRPLTLFYEDIREDMDGTLGAIADYLDVDLDAFPNLSSKFAPQRQKKVAQDDWLTRFTKESRTALDEGKPVAGVDQENRLEKLSRSPIRAARRMIRGKISYRFGKTG